MTDRKAIDFGLGLEAVAKELAHNNLEAQLILTKILQERELEAFALFCDIVDTQMRGAQIAAAWNYAEDDIDAFIAAFATRDPRLIEHVNRVILDNAYPAREHGAQKRIPQTDFAVQSALAQAGVTEITARMDEGAEHVHNFFLALVKTMQAGNNFTTNMRVNLGMESGHSAVFVITLAELLDKEGKPMVNQPTEEDQHLAAALEARMAAEPVQPVMGLDAATKAELDSILAKANQP